MKSGIFWIALFLVLVSSVFSFSAAPRGENFKDVSNFGGPAESSVSSYISAGSGDPIPGSQIVLNNLFVSGSAVVGGENPLIGVVPLAGGLMEYRVKRGDTFSLLAEQFKTTAEEIRTINGNTKALKPGSWIIIPTSAASSTINSISEFSNLPNLKNYFSLPAAGWNWGELHDYNAVDIANQCGTPVYAAADGLVIGDPSLGDGSSGWNDGYGTFVFLEHPNGTKTRYAHLSKALVKVGDVVAKGEEVGLMGNTGNTHGPTGCHLHFEVYGAKNPFAIN